MCLAATDGTASDLYWSPPAERDDPVQFVAPILTISMTLRTLFVASLLPCSVQASAQAQSGRGTTTNAAGRFEPFSQFDGEFGPPFGTASTRAYSVVNVEAKTTLALGLGAPLTVSVGVDNLLNEACRDFPGTYKGYALSPGRGVQVGLSTSF
jgi:hypothetical protein